MCLEEGFRVEDLVGVPGTRHDDRFPAPDAGERQGRTCRLLQGLPHGAPPLMPWSADAAKLDISRTAWSALRRLQRPTGRVRGGTMGHDRSMSESGYRIEHDSMGEVQVPADALWCAQTQRAVENFPISGGTG